MYSANNLQTKPHWRVKRHTLIHSGDVGLSYCYKWPPTLVIFVLFFCNYVLWVANTGVHTEKLFLEMNILLQKTHWDYHNKCPPTLGEFRWLFSWLFICIIMSPLVLSYYCLLCWNRETKRMAYNRVQQRCQFIFGRKMWKNTDGHRVYHSSDWAHNLVSN